MEFILVHIQKSQSSKLKAKLVKLITLNLIFYISIFLQQVALGQEKPLIHQTAIHQTAIHQTTPQTRTQTKIYSTRTAQAKNFRTNNSQQPISQQSISEQSISQRPNLTGAYANQRKIITRFKSGIQSADFKWNIASNSEGNTPSILSELKYEQLEIQHQSLSLNILPATQSLFFPWFFEATAEMGKVREGKIQDSDYDGDNRTQEYSRSISKAEGSNTFIFNTTAGYPWLKGEISQLHLLLGFGIHTQHFEKTQGTQVVSTPGRTPNIGPINGLNSSYDAHWFGPWLGFRPSIKLKNHLLSLTLALHFTRYYAEANWNLRKDFAHPKSFEHKATGLGQVLNLDYEWSFNEKLKLSASLMLHNWQTSNGVDTLFFANGNTASTRLNETHWSSEGVDLGFSWKF